MIATKDRDSPLRESIVKVVQKELIQAEENRKRSLQEENKIALLSDGGKMSGANKRRAIQCSGNKELCIHEEIVGAVHKIMAVYGEQAQGTVNKETSIHEEIVGAVHKDMAVYGGASSRHCK